MAVDTIKRVTELVEQFPECLEVFLEAPPFNKPAQLQCHLETIKMRRSISSAEDALNNDDFLVSLYETLQAWGIGMRASNLKPFDLFCDAIRGKSHAIAELQEFEIDNYQISPTELVGKIWSVISSLDIVDNLTPIVSGTKALHHVLPELIVPVDRAYTQKFFGWQNPEFQYGQERVFSLSFKSFLRIARTVDLDKFVGDGWCSSKTKVIDNAIVGFVLSRKAY